MTVFAVLNDAWPFESGDDLDDKNLTVRRDASDFGTFFHPRNRITIYYIDI